MSDLKMHRDHQLGLERARQVAQDWAGYAEKKLDMRCTVQRGSDCDVIEFNRSGVKGTLEVSAHAFELRARLGLLLGAFKGRIEAEIVKNLDALLAPKPGRKKAAAKK